MSVKISGDFGSLAVAVTGYLFVEITDVAGTDTGIELTGKAFDNNKHGALVTADNAFDLGVDIGSNKFYNNTSYIHSDIDVTNKPVYCYIHPVKNTLAELDNSFKITIQTETNEDLLFVLNKFISRCSSISLKFINPNSAEIFKSSQDCKDLGNIKKVLCKNDFNLGLEIGKTNSKLIFKWKESNQIHAYVMSADEEDYE